jgi:hypothetical protein
MPAVVPDYTAPIVRNVPDGVRELAKARWGMPSSQFALMQSAKKRAEKLEAKGTPVDFKQLLRPTAVRPTFEMSEANIGRDGSVSRIGPSRL